jgi:hypothetical protein
MQGFLCNIKRHDCLFLFSPPHKARGNKAIDGILHLHCMAHAYMYGYLWICCTYA